MPKQVLVTRPEHAATRLCQSIERLGATAVLLPTLKIEIFNDVEVNVGPGDILIFSSANAVHAAVSNSLHIASAVIAAIGPATAATLRQYGFNVDIVAKPFTSEGMLAQLLEKEANGKVIHLISGVDGRQWLQEQLLMRGFAVKKHALYRRVAQKNSEATRQQLDAFQGLIVSGSDEGLDALRRIAQTKFEKLVKMPLVVNSQRGAEFAARLGFAATIYIPEQAGDEGQLVCIKQWLVISDKDRKGNERE